jgi:hypothetical protein
VAGKLAAEWLTSWWLGGCWRWVSVLVFLGGFSIEDGGT